MSTLNPYVFFNGNCAEAMRFYADIIGGKLDILTHADAPAEAQSPPGSAHLVMHARLANEGFELMASDDMPNGNYAGMHGFYLSVNFADVAQGGRVFAALAEGGEVRLAFGKTFWAEGFGMLRDRFGTPWMVNAGMAPRPQ
ncbi:MAG: VOC family protein [Rudaea sp.]